MACETEGCIQQVEAVTNNVHVTFAHITLSCMYRKIAVCVLVCISVCVCVCIYIYTHIERDTEKFILIFVYALLG